MPTTKTKKPTTLGDRLRAARLARGLTHEELALTLRREERAPPPKKILGFFRP